MYNREAIHISFNLERNDLGITRLWERIDPYLVQVIPFQLCVHWSSLTRPLCSQLHFSSNYRKLPWKRTRVIFFVRIFTCISIRLVSAIQTQGEIGLIKTLGKGGFFILNTAENPTTVSHEWCLPKDEEGVFIRFYDESCYFTLTHLMIHFCSQPAKVNLRESYAITLSHYFRGLLNSWERSNNDAGNCLSTTIPWETDVFSKYGLLLRQN